jgi:hypothetical protein
MVEGADGAHMNRSLPLDKCLDDCLRSVFDVQLSAEP